MSIKYSTFNFVIDSITDFPIYHPRVINRNELILVHRFEWGGTSVPVTQRARVLSPVGTSFLGEFFFRGFSSPVRRMSGRFRPTKSANIIMAVIINLSYSPSYNVWVRGCCVSPSCSCCLGGGPSIELMSHPGRTSISLCGQNSSLCMRSRVNSSSRQVVAL